MQILLSNSCLVLPVKQQQSAGRHFFQPRTILICRLCTFTTFIWQIPQYWGKIPRHPPPTHPRPDRASARNPVTLDPNIMGFTMHYDLTAEITPINQVL